MKLNKRKILGLFLMMIFILGYLLPESLTIPVQGASEKDWNHQTFWYEPWGRAGVHKGIDIFAYAGRPVISATNGIILFKGKFSLGGNIIVILGPKWRIHYYAHLQEISTQAGKMILSGQEVGKVGNTGNAKGKPAHLHYSIVSLVPLVWRWDNSTQGWKKMFFLNPTKILKH
ncbi:Peptidase M23B [Beggiatoa sp. PS]|nr:Peptidase M23B [Beggiatoa sp. PS]